MLDNNNVNTTMGTMTTTYPQPSGACPSCGHCPHCGRGGYRAYPPYYPNYFYQGYQGTTGNWNQNLQQNTDYTGI